MKYIIKHKMFAIFFAYFLLFFYFYFLKSSSFINSDEIVNINIYLYPETVLLKNYPNNHIFNSLFGMLIKYSIGIDLIYIRLISFLSLLGIIFFFLKIFKSYLSASLLIIIFTLSNYLYFYSMMFRGYYFSSFLFVMIFFYLKEFIFLKNNKNLKIVFILCSFSIFGLLSNIYLVLPIIITLLLFYKKSVIKNLLLYFVIPTFITQSILIILVGIFENIDLFYNNLKLNFVFLQMILNNFLTIIYSGIDTIFFNTYVQQKLTYESLTNNLYKDKSFFIILGLPLIFTLNNFIKRKYNIFDCIILLFFITFIVLYKSPPLRAHIGYIYFFIFYIFFNLEDKFNHKFFNFKFLIVVSIISLIYLNFKSFNKYPIRFSLISIKDHLFKNNKVQLDLNNCILTEEQLSESNKQYYFYFYMNKCGITKDIMIFKEFYSKNRIKF